MGSDAGPTGQPTPSHPQPSHKSTQPPTPLAAHLLDEAELLGIHCVVEQLHIPAAHGSNDGLVLLQAVRRDEGRRLDTLEGPHPGITTPLR